MLAVKDKPMNTNDKRVGVQLKWISLIILTANVLLQEFPIPFSHTSTLAHLNA